MRGAIVGLALLSVAACEPMTGKPGTAANPASPPATLPAGVPAGAIGIGDDVYMVPAGMLDGCPSFRPFSPTRSVIQAIHFRNRAGGFTMNRAEADCTMR